MDYSLVIRGRRRFMHLVDPPQYLDSGDVMEWMIEARDDNPNLYAELVQIYFWLRKPIGNETTSVYRIYPALDLGSSLGRQT